MLYVLVCIEQWGIGGYLWYLVYKMWLGLVFEQVIVFLLEFEVQVFIGVVVVVVYCLQVIMMEGVQLYVYWFVVIFFEVMVVFCKVLLVCQFVFEVWLLLFVYLWQCDMMFGEIFVVEFVVGELINLLGISIVVCLMMLFCIVVVIDVLGGLMFKLLVSMWLISVECIVLLKLVVMGLCVSVLLECIFVIDVGLVSVLLIVFECYGIYVVGIDDDCVWYLLMIVCDNFIMCIVSNVWLLLVGVFFMLDFIVDMMLVVVFLLFDIVLVCQVDGICIEWVVCFFNVYLCVVILVIVGFYLCYGIVLEVYQQNIFVVISEVGMLEWLVVCDFGDVKIVLLMLQVQGFLIELFCVGYMMYFDWDIFCKKFIYVFLFCYIGELVLVLFLDYGSMVGLC